MLVCQKADGEAASAKLNTLTHAYYVGILKAYVPAIYHGQDLGRGDRCGLRLKARVQAPAPVMVIQHMLIRRLARTTLLKGNCFAYI